jgi:VanZ family protein
MSRLGPRARRWLPWLPVLAVMGLIFVLSSQSGLRVSEDPGVDKPLRISAHMLAYAALAGLALLALSWGRLPSLRDGAFALGLSLLYGLSDELHQSFVPDRTGRLDDVVTDMAGAFIGVGLAWLVLTESARRRETRAADEAGE